MPSKIQKIYNEMMPQLGEAVHTFPWEKPEAYAQWLGQTYYFANITTRLLTLASARMSLEQQNLHIRFIDHAKEERGHEKMLINDLKAIGHKIDQITELPATAALYQSQFYWIEHQNPMAFFGYIIMLEGLGADHGFHMYTEAKKHHGEKAAVFLKVHSTEDIDHVNKAMQQIEDLDPKTEALVVENFRLAASFYLEMMRNAKIAALGLSRAA